MRRLIFSFLILVIIVPVSFSQSKDVQIGTPFTNLQARQGGLYDYSDPAKVNKKVAVWGFVRYPGKYIIPEDSDVMDLLSYSGGPTDDALLEDLRLFRIKPDSTYELFNINWNDLMWEDSVKSVTTRVPELRPGDVLVVPGEPRLYFKDWFSIGLSLFSALISLSILILNIIRL